MVFCHRGQYGRERRAIGVEVVAGKKCHTKTNETGRGLIGDFSESIIVEFVKTNIINTDAV